MSDGSTTARRVIVTGGAGFIGSHLTERLLADGHEVAVLDNFSTGRADNLRDLPARERLTIHRVDVTDFDTIRPHFAGVDCVFHLAALADIVPSITDPHRYFRNNVDGTLAVAESARLSEVPRLVYAASSSCYGIPDAYPTPETAPIRPQYPYALTKHLGEQIVLHWGQVYGLQVVSLRMFNVYGPRSRTTGAYGAVFGVFLAQKIHNRPFTVVGDGSQTRDFTFVSDAVDALQAAAASTLTREVLNVGSGAPHSVNEIATLLGGRVVHVAKRPGEPDCTHADITKIQRLLGWTPKVPFEDGVRILLDRIDDWRDAPVWTPATIAEATREWFRYLALERPIPHGN